MAMMTQYRQLFHLIVQVALLTLLLLVALLVIAVGYWAGWQGVAVLLGGMAVALLARAVLRRWVPRRTILTVDFEHGLVEQTPADPMAQLAAPQVFVVQDVVEALHCAAADRRVVGLVARIGPAHLGLAHAQEVVEAVEVFRRGGKRAVAWCQSLGEGHNATVEYYLASAFDQIHLQPGSDLSLTGLAVQQPFVRRLLDRLDVLPRLDHREQYKSAKYLFTEDQLTAPHRESLEALLNSQLEQITDGIAKGRHFASERVRQLIDQGPFLAKEALEAKLVDHLSYQQQVHDQLTDELRGRFVPLDRYHARRGRLHRRGPRIALIHGVGAVVRGKSQSRRLPRATTMGADDVTAAFRAAIKSKRIRAIVFRIDSPGGSAVASEAIWHEVARARDAGKPVIVSMSNLAGSGGYYIAAAAERIVAQPGTITGSIGVVSGKLVTAGAWRKAGIHWQGVHAGANAAIWSPYEDFDDAGWQKLQAQLDQVYDLFKQRVAEGRQLSTEQVEQVAKGRIWSGAEAKDRGLVDELGGLQRAVELAKAAAKVPAAQGVRLVAYPPRRRLRARAGAFEQLEAVEALLGQVQALADAAAPLAEVAEALHPPAERLLTMPGFDGSPWR